MCWGILGGAESTGICWGHWEELGALGSVAGAGGAGPGGAGRQQGAPSPAGLLLGAAGRPGHKGGGCVPVQSMASRERAAASRLRGDKSRPPTAAAVPTDVVPGRLSEAQWLALVAAEEGDGDVGDVLAELLGRVMEECFRVYLARQRVPFTVSQARDAVLQVAAWRFLARDEGDAELRGDGAWQEDEEPAPCAIDTWAQGSVPVLQEHPSPRPGDREVPHVGAMAGAVPPCPNAAPVPWPGLQHRHRPVRDRVRLLSTPQRASTFPHASASGRGAHRSPATQGKIQQLPWPSTTTSPTQPRRGTAPPAAPAPAQALARPREPEAPGSEGGWRRGGGRRGRTAAASLLQTPGEDPDREARAQQGEGVRSARHHAGNLPAGPRQALDPAPGGGAGPGRGGQAAAVSPCRPPAQPGASEPRRAV
nr:uncharacterized protein C2orf81 homolog isoform X3 [Anser cygnoides]